MESEKRKIARHTSIYTVGTVLRNIATFLMLPIYTRYLTPSDYGIIELLSMIVDFFAIVCGLQLGDAVFRYHAHYRQRRDQNEVITTAIAAVGVLTLFSLLFIIVFADSLSLLVFQDGRHAAQISLFAVTLPFVALTEVAFLYLRAEGRPWLFVGFGTLRLLLQLTLNIYFVVLLRLHVDGVIYAAVIANVVTATAILAFTISRTGFSVSLPKALELVRFSWPLIFASLSAFYLTFGNRYLLQIYTDTTEVGIYSLGFKFGFLLLVFAWRPFAMVWDAARFSIAKKATARKEFRSLFTLVSTGLITLALAIAVFVRDVLMVMAAEQFWRASEIVPLILIAYLFQAWTGYSKLGILLSRKTGHMAYSAVFACVVMTVGCVVLIPPLGGLGAATAVLWGFIARFLWVYYVAKRHYDMELDWKKVAKIGGLALVAYGLSTLSPAVLATSIAVHVIAFSGFVAFLLKAPILSADERETIIGFARGVTGARRLLFGRVD